MNVSRIVMVDDDGIVRDSITAFINSQQDLHLEHAFHNAEDFLEFNFSELPSLLLLDIGLPGMSGLEALPLIKQKHPTLDILMLTTYEEEEKILKALCTGACSYISKRAGLKAILDGIRVVLNGGSYMSPRIAREIVNHFFNRKNNISPLLEGRQKEIMDLMIKGNTYQQIAKNLNISVETVRTHIKKTYRNLEVNNKAEAIQVYLGSHR